MPTNTKAMKRYLKKKHEAKARDATAFFQLKKDQKKEKEKEEAFRHCSAILEACERGPAQVGCAKCLTHMTVLRKGDIMIPASSLEYIRDTEGFFPEGDFSCLLVAQKEWFWSWPQHVMRVALVLLCHELHLCVKEPAVQFRIMDANGDS